MIPFVSSKRPGIQLTTSHKSTPDIAGECGGTEEEPSIKRLCRDFKNLKSPSKAGTSNSTRYTVSAGDLPIDGNHPLRTPIDNVGENIKAPRRTISNLPLYRVESVERKDNTLIVSVHSTTNQTSDSEEKRTCILGGFWVQTPLAPLDDIIIIGDFDSSLTCLINDNQNFLILHPDTLVSPTLIGGTNFCSRKAFFQEIIRSDTSSEMFIGTLVHDLMQRVAVSISKVAKQNGQPAETSQEILNGLLRDARYRQDMYALNMTEEKVHQVASSFLPNIEKWSWSEFSKGGVASAGGVGGVRGVGDARGAGGVKSTGGPEGARGLGGPGGVEVVDIEEWIWSPKFGVKGRVDMTLRTEGVVRPLEIKTGKASYATSHTGQVLLYTLLLSEKYRMDIKEGVLFYAKTGEFKTIAAKHGELRSLIQMRNDISNYLKRCHFVDGTAIMSLPGPIDDPRACSSCPLSTVCTLFYKTVEEPRKLRKLPPFHYMHKMVAEKGTYLQQRHLDYFQKWMIVLYLEVHNSQKNISVLDLWLKKGQESGRAEQGVGGLRLKETKTTEQKQLCHCLSGTVPSTVCLSVGDLILLREDNKEGFVVDLCTINSIQKEPILQIELQTDRFYENSKLKNKNKNKLFRVDKYIYSTSSMGGAYDSLMKLMENEEKAERLRRLFVEKEKGGVATQVPKKQLTDARSLIKPLPKEQQTAVVKCLMSLDYTFIDTKNCSEPLVFVSALINILRKCDQTVLFVSSNGATIDSVLLPLRAESDNKILRLGPASRIHADLKDLCPESLASQKTTFSEFSATLSRANIVATTNSTHRQSALMHRHFDVCLVNEASLMLQPSVFGFLFLAKRFIFVGNSEKKPNCRSPTALEMGMDESLMAAMKETAQLTASWVTL